LNDISLLIYYTWLLVSHNILKINYIQLLNPFIIFSLKCLIITAKRDLVLILSFRKDISNQNDLAFWNTWSLDT